MLYWALVFLLIAVVAGAVGFGGVAVAFAGLGEDRVLNLPGPASALASWSFQERTPSTLRQNNDDAIAPQTRWSSRRTDI